MTQLKLPPENPGRFSWNNNGFVPLNKAEGEGICRSLYPIHDDPRIAAGEPLERTTLKCALKPVDARDYSGKVSSAQLSDLKEIFPKGVCDYTKKPVGLRPLAGTWLVYGAVGKFAARRR